MKGKKKGKSNCGTLMEALHDLVSVQSNPR